MKILHLISGLGVGGAEAMLTKLLKATRSKIEARVASLTGDGPVGECIRSLGVETKFIGLRRGVPDPRGIYAVAREIRAFRPDVLQTWMYHADLIGGLATQIAGRPPVVWGIRGSEIDADTSKWTTRLTLDLCARLSSYIPARIICCGEKARAFHVAAGYDAQRMCVIPNGFELDAFAAEASRRCDVRKECGIPGDAHVIGMVARYDPAKDFGTFVRAAGLAASADSGLVFLLCGEGVTKQNVELCASLDQEGILNRTRLLGRRSDVPRILAALDIFTLSSVSEGFPNVLGEAMASAVPCVATDAGDSALIVGDTGQIVQPRDVEALATQWLSLLRMAPTERTALGRRARTRIANMFSIDVIANEYLRVYEAVDATRRAKMTRDRQKHQASLHAGPDRNG